jgi:hypothetical protein
MDRKTERRFEVRTRDGTIVVLSESEIEKLRIQDTEYIVEVITQEL